MKTRATLVRVSAIVAALAVLCIATQTQAARILLSGNAMDENNPNLTGAIAGLGHTATFVPALGFAGADLAPYDAVWLDGFSEYGADLSDELLAFLNSGGNVFVQNPGFGSQPLSMYPLGAQLAATLTNPPGEAAVRIVTPGHVMNAGLTDEGLSELTPAAFGHFGTIGGFIGLTDTGTDGRWVTIVFNVNNRGFLVYTQQGVAQYLGSAANPGPTSDAATFLNNVVTLSPRPFHEAILDLTLLLDQVTRSDPAAPCRRLPCVPVKDVLLQSVDEAMRVLPEGHHELAVDALWQFVRDTKGFMYEGLLPPAEGQTFIAQAEAIIQQVNDEGDSLSR